MRCSYRKSLSAEVGSPTARITISDKMKFPPQALGVESASSSREHNECLYNHLLSLPLPGFEWKQRL